MNHLREGQSGNNLALRLLLNRSVHSAVCLSLITLFVMVFIQKGILQSVEDFKSVPSHGRDLWNFRAGGYLWGEGKNPSDPVLLDEFWSEQSVSIRRIEYANIMYYYPPQTSFLFSWLSRLSFETSYWLFLVINIFLTLIVLGLLGYILSWYLPIGILEITLLSSFLHIGLRTNIRFNQISTLIAVFILLSFVMTKRKKESLAGISLGITSLKPTFFPLLWLYNLFFGSKKHAVTCIFTGGLMTVLPIILSNRELFDTIASFLRARQIHQNAFDSPSPFDSTSITLQNIEPLVFRILNQQSSLTILLSWMVILVLCILTFYQIYKNRHLRQKPLLDFAMISVLTILIVYHKNYDSFLLFPGFLYLFIQIKNMKFKNSKLFWLLFFLVILGIKILPTNFLYLFLSKTPLTIDTYIGRLFASFHVWGNIFLLGALLIFKKNQHVLKNNMDKTI